MGKALTKKEIAALQRMKNEGKLEQLLLSNFTQTLEEVLKQKLAKEYPAIVLQNPTNGKTATCVSHVLRVLAFGWVSNWNTGVKNKIKALEDLGVFEHQFEGYQSSTICVDLDKVEELIPLLFPRKGPKQLAWFCRKHSVA